jgi:hypothetical protein
MTDQAPAERILSGFLRVVLDEKFDAEERAAAATALRSGGVIECILKYLDYPNGDTPSSPNASSPGVASAKNIRVPAKMDRQMEIPTVDQVFDLVRKKKIGREDMLEIINRLEPLSSTDIDGLSMRETLRFFRLSTSEVQWVTFYKIISGSISTDPYVSSILKHR